MTSAALFDWDGTLADSAQALLGAWHLATMEVLGRQFPSTPEEEELIFTLPGSHLFPRVSGDPERGAQLAAAFQRAYETTTAERVRAFPGVPAMLRDLRAADVAVGVITSKARRRFELDAQRIGVLDLIDVAVCQEDTTAHKPDPAPVLRALEELGLDPGAAVYAGDTPVDIAAGSAAGTAVLGVAWGASGARPLLEAGAHAVADDPSHLTRLVLERDLRPA